MHVAWPSEAKILMAFSMRPGTQQTVNPIETLALFPREEAFLFLILTDLPVLLEGWQFLGPPFGYLKSDVSDLIMKNTPFSFRVGGKRKFFRLTKAGYHSSRSGQNRKTTLSCLEDSWRKRRT